MAKDQDKLDSINEVTIKMDKELAVLGTTLEAHFKQDESMYEELKRMNDILQQNTDSLREHMHRTNLLEDVVANMDKRFSPIEMEHVKKNAVREWYLEKLKLIGKVGGALVAIASVLEIARHLIK